MMTKEEQGGWPLIPSNTDGVASLPTLLAVLKIIFSLREN